MIPPKEHNNSLEVDPQGKEYKQTDREELK